LSFLRISLRENLTAHIQKRRKKKKKLTEKVKSLKAQVLKKFQNIKNFAKYHSFKFVKAQSLGIDYQRYFDF